MSHDKVSAATFKHDTGVMSKASKGPAASQHLRNSGDILGHADNSRGQVRNLSQMQGKQASGLSHQYGSGAILAHEDTSSRKTANAGAVNSTAGPGFTTKAASGAASSQ